MQPFSQAGATVTIAVTASSVPTAIGALPADAPNCEVYNPGSQECFLVFGIGAQPTATATGYPVGPGQSKVVSKGRADTAAAICPGGTTTLRLTPGHGV